VKGTEAQSIPLYPTGEREQGEGENTPSANADTPL